MYHYLTLTYFSSYSSSNRRNAALDMLGMHEFLGEEGSRVWLRACKQTTIRDGIIQYLESGRNIFGFKRKSIRFGDVKFKRCTVGKRKQPAIKVYTKGVYVSPRICVDDQDFLYWYMCEYSFGGIGNLTPIFEKGLKALLAVGVDMCLTHFHSRIVSNGKREPSAGHCAERIMYGYCGLQTFLNVVNSGGMESLVPYHNWQGVGGSVIAQDFEEMCNLYNGTDLHIVHRWFNAERDQKDYKAQVDIAVAIAKHM